jgi:hypothetical protein
MEKDSRLAGFYQTQTFAQPTSPSQAIVPETQQVVPRKVVQLAPEVQDWVIVGIAAYSLTLTYPFYFWILWNLLRVFVFYPISLLF